MFFCFQELLLETDKDFEIKTVVLNITTLASNNTALFGLVSQYTRSMHEATATAHSFPDYSPHNFPRGWSDRVTEIYMSGVAILGNEIIAQTFSCPWYEVSVQQEATTRVYIGYSSTAFCHVLSEQLFCRKNVKIHPAIQCHVHVCILTLTGWTPFVAVVSESVIFRYEILACRSWRRRRYNCPIYEAPILKRFLLNHNDQFSDTRVKTDKKLLFLDDLDMCGNNLCMVKLRIRKNKSIQVTREYICILIK